jgi:hypothetical protein
MSEITELLVAARSGDPAAADKAFGLLYDDLRRLARAKLRQHQPMTLLDTTSLVHESYLKLVASMRGDARRGVMRRPHRAGFVSYLAERRTIELQRRGLTGQEAWTSRPSGRSRMRYEKSVVSSPHKVAYSCRPRVGRAHITATGTQGFGLNSSGNEGDQWRQRSAQWGRQKRRLLCGRSVALSLRLTGRTFGSYALNRSNRWTERSPSSRSMPAIRALSSSTGR